jgi:hypothetical protein
MRSPFRFVGERLRTDKKARALARLISACGYGQKPSAYPAEMTLTSPGAGA